MSNLTSLNSFAGRAFSPKRALSQNSLFRSYCHTRPVSSDTFKSPMCFASWVQPKTGDYNSIPSQSPEGDRCPLVEL